jgi:hypothetical protein
MLPVCVFVVCLCLGVKDKLEVDAKHSFYCYTQAAGLLENPCEAVSIANLVCPEAPEKEEAEMECDCCGDGRRRLLWWSRPCLCCKVF